MRCRTFKCRYWSYSSTSIRRDRLHVEYWHRCVDSPTSRVPSGRASGHLLSQQRVPSHAFLLSRGKACHRIDWSSIIGHTQHNPISFSLEFAHQLPSARRIPCPLPPGWPHTGLNRRSHEKPRLLRLILTRRKEVAVTSPAQQTPNADSRAWCICTPPPSSFSVAPFRSRSRHPVSTHPSLHFPP